jgi:hypothetical protein
MRSEKVKKSYKEVVKVFSFASEKNKSRLIPAHVLENLTTTTYEKVINNLKELKDHFKPKKHKTESSIPSFAQSDNKDMEIYKNKIRNTVVENSINESSILKENLDDSNDFFNKINFIIDAIQSQNLYNYECNNFIDESNDPENELRMGYLDSYSEQNTQNKRNQVKHKTMNKIDIPFFKTIKEENEIEKNKVSLLKIKSFAAEYHGRKSLRLSDMDDSNISGTADLPVHTVLENNTNHHVIPETCDLVNIPKNKTKILDDTLLYNNNLDSDNNSKSQNKEIANNQSSKSCGLKGDETISNEKEKKDCINLSFIEIKQEQQEKIFNIDRVINNINKNFENPHNILDRDFNIFNLVEKVGENHVMPIIVKTCFENIDDMFTTNLNDSTGILLKSLIDFDKLQSFSVMVREKYRQNPYHNSIHGTDVFHAMHQVFLYSPILKWLKLKSIDVVSCLIAALMHDIGHPGFNNNFMINSKSDLAMIYNDQHVLENFHAAEGFRILTTSNTNIFNKLNKNQFAYLRKRFIQMILSTDPSSHSKIKSLVNNKIVLKEVKNGQNVENLVSEDKFYEDQQEVLDLLISYCDTSHSCRKFEVTFNWSERLMKEFWHQGDVEKELNIPVSFLCDRVDAYVGKGQIGFIQMIITPGVTSLVTMCPSLDFLLDNLKENIKKWQEYLDALQIEKKK